MINGVQKNVTVWLERQHFKRAIQYIVLKTVQYRRINLIGHILRNESLTKTVSEGMVEDKKGKPTARHSRRLNATSM